MVPIAGDEVTEAISDQYLLDFPLAEKAKRELLNKEQIVITDILGFEIEVSKDEVIEKVNPVLDRLATSICDEVLRLNNNQPPKAIMLVGGGSLTPEITIKIAHALNLPENRVAIRDINAISTVTLSDHIDKSPELVTPIGIAISAQKSPVHYRTVYVNDQPVRLFEVNQLTVGDCLLASGIKLNKLYGKPGMALIISLNGQTITIPGSHGEAPLLLKNDVTSSLDDPVKNEDHLTAIKGSDGVQPKVYIYDLLDGIPEKTVNINGKTYTITAKVFCNGKLSSPKSILSDRDNIQCQFPETIEEMLKDLHLQTELETLRPFRINLNGKETFIPPFSGKLYRNGIEVKLSSSFEHLDELLIAEKIKPTVEKLAEIKHIMLTQCIPVTFNGKPIVISKDITVFTRKDRTLSHDDLLNDGDIITYEQKEIKPFVFQDLFKHVQIKIPPKTSGRYTLMRNNQQTTFFGKIEPGDDLKIEWPTEKIETKQ